MAGEPLITRYKHLFPVLTRLARGENVITEHNVYQEANLELRKIVDEMLDENLLPNSLLAGQENFKSFLEQVKKGKRGLILMEHYSNFDLPALSYLLRKQGGKVGEEIAERLVAIAGMKLNEESAIISAWAEAFSRVVIYPSRSLAAIQDPEEREIEELRSKKINMASMRAMDKAKKEGKIILVFPAGTRFRKNKPETKRGVREIDSYLRLSDIMLPVSINGNCLRISDDNPSNMMMDEVCPDTVIFAAGPVIECKQFRKDIQEKLPEDLEDKKQPVVDEIMNILERQHNEYEIEREKLL